jgi:hypothetical protein
VSVTTLADERIQFTIEQIDEAGHALDRAIESLAEVAEEECWGWDDYNKEYQKKCLEALDHLRHLRCISPGLGLTKRLLK